MVDIPTDPIIPYSGEGSNVHSTSSTCYSKFVNSSQPKPECEIPYDQLQMIHPITRQFAKIVRLNLGVISLPYSPKKNKTNSTWIVALTLEEAVLSTFEDFADFLENQEEPPLFHSGDGDNIPLLNSTFGGIGGEKEKEEEEPSDSDK